MITIDYGNTNIINVPQAYLNLVEGTLYSLDTNTFRLALKTIEASETGMVFPDTNVHGTTVTVAGSTYARTIQIISPYSIEFEDGQYSVRLEGSNNNIFDIEEDILEQNQVQVIPTNSAGLVTSGESDYTDILEEIKNKPTGGGGPSITRNIERKFTDKQLKEIAKKVAPGITNAVIEELSSRSLDFNIKISEDLGKKEIASAINKLEKVSIKAIEDIKKKTKVEIQDNRKDILPQIEELIDKQKELSQDKSIELKEMLEKINQKVGNDEKIILLGRLLKQNRLDLSRLINYFYQDVVNKY